MTRDELQKYASEAGFGANLRNTYAVRLERFAAKVRAATLAEAAERCAVAAQDAIDVECVEDGDENIAAAIEALGTEFAKLAGAKCPT